MKNTSFYHDHVEAVTLLSVHLILLEVVLPLRQAAEVEPSHRKVEPSHRKVQPSHRKVASGRTLY